MSLKFLASTIARRIGLTVRSTVLLLVASFAVGNAYGQTETITYTGEVDAVTGAFVALTPLGTVVGGPLVVNAAALTAGSIGVADIVSIDVNVGGFCFATGAGTCGGVGTLVPITSIDSAAITGSSGELGGAFAVTAFSPTFNVSIPIIFNLDTGLFSADGGALGTVGGFGVLEAPVVAAPEIETDPVAGTTLDFGQAVVGTGDVVRTVDISSIGDLLLNISTITLDGNPANVAITGGCVGPLVALTGTCTVTLTLSPTAPGVINSTLNIASDDGDEGLLTFPVIGSVVLPAALESNTSMAMPLLIDSVAVGDTMAGTITVTNTGGIAALLGTATMPNAPFSLTAADTCSGQMILGGAICTIEVLFAPTAAGQFASNFTLQIAEPLLANGGVATSTNMFVMSSTLDPAATPSTNSLIIADTMINSTNTATLVITNTGDADLSIATVTGLSPPFSISSEDCTTADIVPTETCSVTVEFAPTAEITSIGTLSVTSNDPDSPLVVSVSALGTEELLPNIVVTPTNVVFATPLLIGESETQSVTVSNMGTADLTIQTLLVVPVPQTDFFFVTNTCTDNLTLAPMEQCTFSQMFQPSAPGLRQSTVTVISDDPDESQVDVIFSGTGVMPDPNIMLSATALDLGVETVGDSVTGTVTVSNMGTADLDVSSITIPAGVFSQANDCVTPLAPMASCTVTVTFAPTSEMTFNDTLTIVSDDPDTMMSTVSLTGRGVDAPEPNIASNVTMLAFGTGLFGETLDESVVITNNGSAALTISSVTIGGTDAGEFTLGGNCAGMLAVGANCTATVQFAPAAPEGAKSATLSVASDDADTPSLDIPLTGTSDMPEPGATFSSTDISFPDTIIGETSTETITVTAVGTGDLVVTNVDFGSGLSIPFSVDSETCTAAPLPVGSTCEFVVSFTPTMLGSFDSPITFNSNDLDPFLIIEVGGQGVAAPVPDIAADVTTLSFGSVLFGESGVLNLTITNAGDADLTISGATIAPMGDFTSATTCAVLAPSATCTVEVTYAPTQAGDVAATLTVASDDADTPALAIALTGTGIPPEPEIEVSATELMFGSIVAETTEDMTLTVSNTGMADLTINSVTVSGTDQALFSQTNDCATVAMGATCEVVVTFAPTASGDAVATLTLVSNDADEGSVDIALAGVATPVPMPMINVPATLDIGEVNGGEVGTGTITVSNMGTADLTISDVSIAGAGAADFSQANACATIAVGATCDITIEFTPAAIGAANADVVITSNDTSSPSTVAVTATALFPVPALSVSALDLGGVRIGESGNATVTISNSGNAPLVVLSAVLTGADVADFTLNNGCANVAVGASCTITATFTPQSQGSKMAAITITTNDPTQAVVEIPLSATGAPMEEVVVTVESKGGNGSFGWLELGGLLLLIGLARRVSFRAVAMGLAIVATPLALADDHEGMGKDGYWYAGAGFGSTDGQANVGSIEQGIEDAGVSVTSLDIDDSDSGYKLFGGYQATEHLAVEVGYVDLGEAGVDLQLGDVALSDLPLISRAVSGNLSLLGSGVFGAVVVKQSIGETFGVFARLGLVSWEVDTAITGSTMSGDLNIRETESGTDFTFGVGADAWFGAERKFGLRGEWERYELGEQDAEILSLSVLYRF